MSYKLYLGDCIDRMSWLQEGSVDLILVDPPYGSTRNKWDLVIPFEPMWNVIWATLADRGIAVFFGSEPFSSFLRLSQLKYFKYDWVWNKVNKFSGHLNAKKQPLRVCEYVHVFYRKPGTYNPQMIKGEPYRAISSGRKTENYGKQKDNVVTVNSGLYYPKNLLSIRGDERGTAGRLHPTQKPVLLLEYLIKTYTNGGDTVLDFCMGSGSTGVAALKLGRKFIGVEKDLKYFEIAKKRIEAI